MNSLGADSRSRGHFLEATRWRVALWKSKAGPMEPGYLTARSFYTCRAVWFSQSNLFLLSEYFFGNLFLAFQLVVGRQNSTGDLKRTGRNAMYTV